MRILWLCPYIPAPTSGAGTRVFNLLKGLAPTSDIHLIAMGAGDGPSPMYRAELGSLCRKLDIVAPRVSSPGHKRLLQLRSLVSRYPAQYWMFYSGEMQDRINSAARGISYDVVILESSFLGYYALPGHVPRVLDQHNVESEILLRSGQRERSLIRRTYNLLEYWKYRSDEQRVCSEMDLILATSERDREIMLRWRGVQRCVVIPNGVDTDYFAPVEEGVDGHQSPTVVFTGTMAYAPNAEAMLYFTGEIWPLIREHVPGAMLQIVGQGPPPEILKLAEHPGVTVTGAVPDVRPYLGRARVVVAPLRIGGGTRLKILEALAMARPVVSTSLGCEGLDVENGRHLLVADEPHDFAGCVVDLLRDPARRTVLGREGRRLVEELYDWRALGVRMEAALRDLRRARRVPGPTSVHEPLPPGSPP